MDSFDALYVAYAGPLRRFVRRLLGDDEDAADVTHDVFMRAYTRIAGLREPERARPWLFCVARNAAIDHLRRRALLASLRDQHVCAAALWTAGDRDLDAPDVIAARAEARALVWQIGAGLAPRNLAVLERSTRRCQDAATIAAALGTTTGNVYVMLTRARAEFRRAAATYALLRAATTACPVLRETVAAADIRPFSPAVRAAVERHADRCADCGEQRRCFADAAVVRAALDDLAPIDAT